MVARHAASHFSETAADRVWALSLIHIWLEEEESNALYDNLFAYLLDSGIYGKDENGIWNKFAEEKKKGKTAGRQQLKFWYAFPPLHYMAEYYPYLEDCPWLLPWAWLVRGITGLAKHKGCLLYTSRCV